MPLVGTMLLDDRERMELRNCPTCGSTRAVEVSRCSSSGNWRVVTKEQLGR